MTTAAFALSLSSKLASGAPLSDDDYYCYLESLDAARPGRVSRGAWELNECRWGSDRAAGRPALCLAGLDGRSGPSLGRDAPSCAGANQGRSPPLPSLASTARPTHQPLPPRQWRNEAGPPGAGGPSERPPVQPRPVCAGPRRQGGDQRAERAAAELQRGARRGGGLCDPRHPRRRRLPVVRRQPLLDCARAPPWACICPSCLNCAGSRMCWLSF